MDPYIPAPNRDATPRDVLVDMFSTTRVQMYRAVARPLCGWSVTFAACVMSLSMFITCMVTLILFAEPDATWTPWATLILTCSQALACAIMWSNIAFGRALLKAEDSA